MWLCHLIIMVIKMFVPSTDPNAFVPPCESINSNTRLALSATSSAKGRGTIDWIEAPVTLVWFCIVFPLGLDQSKRSSYLRQRFNLLA
jgi:hypothetical protein